MLAGAACLALAGCGAGAPRDAAPAPAAHPLQDERAWIAYTGAYIDDLAASVLLTTNGGSDLRAARAALRDDSHLYALLVAYLGFDGCRRALRDSAAPN